MKSILSIILLMCTICCLGQNVKLIDSNSISLDNDTTYGSVNYYRMDTVEVYNKDSPRVKYEPTDTDSITWVAVNTFAIDTVYIPSFETEWAIEVDSLVTKVIHGNVGSNGEWINPEWLTFKWQTSHIYIIDFKTKKITGEIDTKKYYQFVPLTQFQK